MMRTENGFSERGLASLAFVLLRTVNVAQLLGGMIVR